MLVNLAPFTLMVELVASSRYSRVAEVKLKLEISRLDPADTSSIL